jgi:3-methyladenine DNA glycosylase Tag
VVPFLAVETFAAIYERAAKRHGGRDALEALVTKPKSRAALRRVPDDRILAEMTRQVFNAGFVWRVIEAKWPGFEEAFSGFEPRKVARLSNDDLAKLRTDERIVRNPQKIEATRANARFVVELAKEHGSAARWLADWPEADFVGLWEELRTRGSRLGGFSGQMFLRHVGRDTPMLTADVTAALRRAGVLTAKSAASKKALSGIQTAFGAWRKESGRSLTEISRVLACSTGQVRDPFDH